MKSPTNEHAGNFTYFYAEIVCSIHEKKWHRSKKMDKNKNVQFSKVEGKVCKKVNIFIFKP